MVGWGGGRESSRSGETKNICRKEEKRNLLRELTFSLSLSCSHSRNPGVLVQKAQPRAGSLRLIFQSLCLSRCHSLGAHLPFSLNIPITPGVCYMRLPNLSNCTRLTCYVPPCYSISVPPPPTTQSTPPASHRNTKSIPPFGPNHQSPMIVLKILLIGLSLASSLPTETSLYPVTCHFLPYPAPRPPHAFEKKNREAKGATAAHASLIA
ncbi:hypothetical protein BJY52DRAFT_353603 [Lactarius psammicola]|nr:hypothetical protein BJY52DRAFT_353603 [Lactarius psammicola]